MVPEQGSVGASGDLAPLSHLFLPLIGEGEVFFEGQIKNSKWVLDQFGIKPIQLHPKAGLALINGTQFILAHEVRTVDKLYHCLSHADLIGSLMIEGLKGSQMPFHQSLHQARPFKGNIHVAKRINRLLEDSIKFFNYSVNSIQDLDSVVYNSKGNMPKDYDNSWVINKKA